MDREQDILQIRKYLNGDLNAQAMHELERRALDDPFLMDALEGFGQFAAKQDTNLAELSGRLHKRIEKNEGRIIPWIPLSAAASILIVLGIGFWFFANKNDSEKAKSAVVQNIVADKKVRPVASVPIAIKDSQKSKNDLTTVQNAIPGLKKDKNSEAVRDNGIAVLKESSIEKSKSQSAQNKPAIVAQANSPQAAMAAPSSTTDKPSDYGYLSPRKDSVGTNELLVSDIAKKKKAGAFATLKSKTQPETQTLVQSRVDGVSVVPDDNRTIMGTVMSDNGVPITGATVKVVGRSFGAVTDANGKFVLTDVAKSQTLSVNYLGYSGKKVKADRDSMNISLEPASSSLAEVVLTHDTPRDKADKVEEAHPHDGWQALDDYLKKNAQSPDGKTGKVKLTLIVAANGTLSQFKIVKSLSDQADKKAISLIVSGPAWVGGTDGQPKQVSVTVKFQQ